QDYKEALKWLKKSAEQGYAGAHFHLGMMHETGQGLHKNCVKAHMFYAIAAADGHKEAADAKNHVAQSMTAKQLEKAQLLAQK
ncbi:MAG: sel1 repeat family protein, partial [Methylococcales bacterium]